MGAASPAPAMRPDPDDPFGGGAGSFDPTEGLLDAGDVQPRGSKGLVVFAALLAAVVGGIAGWQGRSILEKNDKKEIASNKGEQMVSEVQQVADVRKGVSLAMEDLEKKIATDPAAASDEISSLLAEEFDKHPKIDALFGWQLASITPQGVKRTFDLYDEANRLQLDLGYLARFLQENADALEGAGGPTLFAVVFKGDSVQMVEAIAPLCGESAENPEGLKPCEGSSSSNAVAYQVRTSIGGEPVVVPRGTEKGQAMLLVPEGQIYNYAVGLEPAKNAMKMRIGMVERVKARLEAMAKAEKVALEALQKYAEDPNVDGDAAPAE